MRDPRSRLSALVLALAFAAPSGACARGAPASSGARTTTPAEGPPADRIASGVAWTYEVTPSEDGRELTVEALYPAGAHGPLRVDEQAMPYLHDVRGAQVTGLAPAALEACLTPCTVSYGVHLGAAADAIDDPDVAASFEGGVVSPASAWLLHPDADAPEVLRIRARGPGALLSGAPASRDGAPGSYELRGAEFDDTPHFGFGRFRALEGHVGAQSIRIGVAGAPNTPLAGMSDPELTRWVEAAAEPLHAYFGELRAENPLVLLVPAPGGDVEGVTLGGGGASVLLRIGPGVTREDATSGWVLTHELVHVNVPSFGRPHRWFEEGLATYLEPLARARLGTMKVDAVWHDLLENTRYGAPSEGDQGLDSTNAWGRTYWGGALFCLSAEVAIRSRTRGAKALDDALRAMASAGRGAATRMPLEDAIRIADAATGVPVLAELYGRLALHPGRLDLDAQWRALGVAKRGRAVIYDESAPLAGVRRAITAAPVRGNPSAPSPVHDSR